MCEFIIKRMDDADRARVFLEALSGESQIKTKMQTCDQIGTEY